MYQIANWIWFLYLISKRYKVITHTLTVYPDDTYVAESYLWKHYYVNHMSIKVLKTESPYSSYVVHILQQRMTI
jgi:hypothetical protein